MTLRLPDTPEGRAHAAALLRDGGLVAIPTETVYGLAALYDASSAVARVFEAKGRPADDPLIVHLALRPSADPIDAFDSYGLLGTITDAQTPTIQRLASCWPGPLTMVVPRGPGVDPAITAGGRSVALRVPAHPTALDILRRVRSPLVAPSANRFGRISPTTADAVLAELDGRIDAVLDGGPCAVGVESTVVRVRRDGGIERLRPGAITDDALTALLGVPPRVPRRPRRTASPGLAASHYAPAAPVVIGPPDALPPQARRVAILAWRDPGPWADALIAAGRTVVARAALAPDERPDTAAQSLFSALRTLDDAAPDAILAEPVPDGSGLLDALRDRLSRAAARR